MLEPFLYAGDDRQKGFRTRSGLPLLQIRAPLAG